MRSLSSLDQTAFSELVERAHDVQFSDQFPTTGSFIKLRRHNREYWYHRTLERGDGSAPPKLRSKYVGPVDDVEVTRRVENASALKADYTARRKLASQLRRSGLPSPSATEGEAIEKLAANGLFRLRAILVGSHAFQAYGGLLGIKLDRATYRTDDIDIAQFYSISVLVDDSMTDIGNILEEVDSTFKPIFNAFSPNLVAGYRNKAGLKIEILTPNRGDADYGRGLSKLPALGNIGAQALPFLDFLIYEPVRSVVLHGAGVGVVVPAPQRFAVHKLILSTRRQGGMEAASKVSKDLAQSASLIRGLAEAKQDFELGAAWMEAWRRGPKWRKHLAIGSLRLQDSDFGLLEDAVCYAEKMTGTDRRRHGMGDGKEGLVNFRRRMGGVRPQT